MSMQPCTGISLIVRPLLQVICPTNISQCPFTRPELHAHTLPAERALHEYGWMRVCVCVCVYVCVRVCVRMPACVTEC